MRKSKRGGGGGGLRVRERGGRGPIKITITLPAFNAREGPYRTIDM